MMDAGKKDLLAALKAENVKVIGSSGKTVRLKHNFVVEIEGASLFKLLDDGYVVAPFASARELAGFVRMDLLQRGLRLD
ncbi:MAG: hypothetical protein AAFN92_22515 [Bacteroidota bacterium]